MAINAKSFTDHPIVGKCKIKTKILNDFDWLSRIKKVKSGQNNKYEYILVQYNKAGVRKITAPISKKDAMFIISNLHLQQFTNDFGETTYLYG